MTRDDFLKEIRRLALVPVIKLEGPDSAAEIGQGLMDGGLPVAEITFRSAYAVEGIRFLRREYPGMLVGAGTVLNRRQADEALAAGARFLVAPGFNPELVSHVISAGALMIPGICTPSEIEQAAAMGLSLLKFFPAEVRGGVAFLKAVAPVYPEIAFMPTGGINQGNIASYLELPQVAACGGSWIVKPGQAGAIAEETRKVRELIGGIRHG